jgi:hypothetical protein
MERLTERAGATYILPPERLGAAAVRLGALETLWERLLERQAAIPGELEALRFAGREKTVQFRELMAEKLTNHTVLDALERAEKYAR